MDFLNQRQLSSDGDVGGLIPGGLMPGSNNAGSAKGTGVLSKGISSLNLKRGYGKGSKIERPLTVDEFEQNFIDIADEINNLQSDVTTALSGVSSTGSGPIKMIGKELEISLSTDEPQVITFDSEGVYAITDIVISNPSAVITNASGGVFGAMDPFSYEQSNGPKVDRSKRRPVRRPSIIVATTNDNSMRLLEADAPGEPNSNRGQGLQALNTGAAFINTKVGGPVAESLSNHETSLSPMGVVSVIGKTSNSSTGGINFVGNSLVANELYFSLDSVEDGLVTCDVYVFGYKICEVGDLREISSPTTTTTTETPTTTTTTTTPVITKDVVSQYLSLERSGNGLYNSNKFDSYDDEKNNISTALDITHLWAMEWNSDNGSAPYRVSNLWSTFDASMLNIDQLVLNVRSLAQGNVLHTFKEVLENAMTYYGGTSAILNKELIMLDVFDRKFYKVKITRWDDSTNEFSYTKELFYTSIAVAPGYFYRFNDFRPMQELWGEDANGNVTLVSKKWSAPFSLPNTYINVVEAIVRSNSVITKGVGLNSYGQGVDAKFVIPIEDYSGEIPYFVYDFSDVSNSQTTNSQYFVDQFSANGITDWDGTRRFVVKGNTVVGNQIYYIGTDGSRHLMSFANEVTFADPSVKLINDANGYITFVTTTGGQYYSNVTLFNDPVAALG